MSKQRASIPKGTRDFSPEIMVKRNFIFDTIREVYELYGFLPIETPAMENLSTLMGKYGEEGDKLLFKILNSGDYLKNADENKLDEKNSIGLISDISDRGLRYDLTVPFARYIVQHQNEIQFPFKRYQIQPVWRADRPQKGRYREFYQCDGDVIGSDSLINEMEFVQIIDKVFEKLNLDVVIKINNRKVLAGIAEYIGHPDKIVDITVAIDKLDKIGVEKVNEELNNKGLSNADIEKLQPVLLLEGDFIAKIDSLSKLIGETNSGKDGIEEISTLFDLLSVVDVNCEYELDLTLARGLNYYTGAIFEVKSREIKIGSICGGGRYDDLTGVFGLKNVSGVGISFGADRIFDVLEQLNKFPDSVSKVPKVMFVNFGNVESRYVFPLAGMLRTHSIPCEIYPDASKMNKQMKFADNRKVRFVIMAGDDEIAENKITVKDMFTGNQDLIEKQDIVGHIKKLLQLTN